jgi:hypothetical protein
MKKGGVLIDAIDGQTTKVATSSYKNYLLITPIDSGSKQEKKTKN